MALSKTLVLTDNFGEDVAIANAYIKVLHTMATKSVCSVMYAIMRSPDGPSLQQESVSFAVDLDGPNPIKQAYLYLKTLPEFADAVDC